jgi:aminopeptidase N
VLQPKVEGERLSFALPRKLAPGNYTLDIAYAGVINQQTQGLYAGRYNTPSGQEKIMLSTQMEPADARSFVPCWDEPVFRATFQVAVDLPAALAAYSNTPVEKTETLADGRKRTTFQRTPKMASYLVVLVAGELEELTAEQDGVRYGIVTMKGKKATGAYAMKASQELVRYYNDYFGTAYPLPKLDQFGVPSTAGFGAMENWGGITYDEAILLFDERTSAPGTRSDIYSVIAHEISHQWFGDLVTMAWWDNLWLNEGFAQWMGTKATAHHNPEWNYWRQGHKDREVAMRLDARKTTHPIQQPVRNEADASDQFDVITYRKGMGVLRMLETWLGADAFRDGIRAYMKKHAYSNTTTADLWDALEKSSGKPVRKFAASWVERPGFPVIKVAASCDKGTRRIEMSQEHFSVDGAQGKQQWTIPIEIAAGGVTAFEVLEGRTRTVKRPGCDGPVVLDPNAVGYFRVEYSPELLADLTARWRELGADARLKLLSDNWALAGVGRVTLSSFLAMVEQARNDTEPAIWDEILGRFDKLDELAEGDPLRAALRRFAVSVMQPRLKALGWEAQRGDSQETLELRPHLLEMLGEFGDEGVRAEAQTRFRKFLKKPSSLPAELADPVTLIAGLYADAATHAKLAELARTAPGSEEQGRYLKAMARVQDPALAAQALQLSLGDTLASSLATRIPQYVGEDHRQLAWDFVTRHYAEISKRLASYEVNGYFGEVLGHCAEARCADELESWSAKNLPATAKTLTQRNANAIRVNAQLKQRLLPQLGAALNK